MDSKDSKQANAVVITQDFFVDKDTALRLTHDLLTIEEDSKFRQVVQQYQTCLEKYQEQPVLLEPHLFDLINPFIDACIPIIRRDGSNATPSIDEFKYLHRMMEVRGWRSVQKCFPHDVSDLEPAFDMLLSLDQEDSSIWKTRYVMILWLSMLLKVPFNLESIDSKKYGSSLMETMIESSKKNFLDAGITCDAAAELLGRLLTRPDIEAPYLSSYLSWSCEKIIEFNGSKEHTMAQQFEVNGIYLSMFKCFRYGDRKHLMKGIKPCLEPLMQVCVVRPESHTVVRKLVVKLIQRLGMCLLPPRVASWRYERGSRSLTTKLTKTSTHIITHDSAQQPTAPKIHKTSDWLPDSDRITEDEDEDEEVESGEELMALIDNLFVGLRDVDTVVRWSAAKGIGRIANRLSMEMGDDVVNYLIDIFSPSEDENAWHGACLCLGELSRRGLLLPEKLSVAIPVVCKALTYDSKRGSFNVGMNVRDAACYVCWAFARAYSPDVMKSYIHPLSCAMLSVSAFDREIMCRRAAAAAFQENVGRQGHANFKHGIDIIGFDNYFTVGNRKDSFLTVGYRLCLYEEYRRPLIDHLISLKVCHWDDEVSQLACEVLSLLAQLDPKYVCEEVIPTLLSLCLSKVIDERRGSITALGQIVFGLSRIAYQIPEQYLSMLCSLISEVETHKFYRGKGAEIMRSTMCNFMKCLVMSGYEWPDAVKIVMFKTIDDCLANQSESLQSIAAESMKELLKIVEPSDEWCDRGVVKYYQLLLSDSIESGAAIRGACLALGCVNSNLLSVDRTLLSCVLNVLYKYSQPSCRKIQDGDTSKDVQLRINAMISLANIAASVPALASDSQTLILDALIGCMNDHQIDDRGDIGSSVRTCALNNTKRILESLIFGVQPALPTPLSTKFGKCYLVEKVDHENVKVQYVCGQLGSIMFPLGVASHHIGEFDCNPLFVQPIPAELMNPVVSTLPEESARELSFVPDAEKLVEESIRDARPAEFSGVLMDGSSSFQIAAKPSSSIWSSQASTRVVGCIISQLGNKIDGVRKVAASVLESILHNTPSIPFIPHSSVLKSIIPANDVICWDNPSDCYQRLIPLLYVDEYRDYIVEGFIVSVGGLTESVRKASASALNVWVNECVEHKKDHFILKFLDSGSSAHSKAQSSLYPDRITLPWIKTLRFMLENELLSNVWSDDHVWASEGQAMKLISELKSIILASKNVTKLQEGGHLFVQLLQFKNHECKQIAFKALAHMLGCSLPRVRSFIANQMYIFLLSAEEVIDEDSIDEVLEILTRTPWNGQLSDVRTARNKLCEIFGIPIPKLTRKAEKPSAPGEEKGFSYSDIVDRPDDKYV